MVKEIDLTDDDLPPPLNIEVYEKLIKRFNKFNGEEPYQYVSPDPVEPEDDE